MEKLDKEVLLKRIKKLDEELTELRKQFNINFKEYLNNKDVQAIVERRLQLCVQTTIDIANYIITRKRLEIPEEEENIFIILHKNKIISKNLAIKIKPWLRFRNILVHNYFNINPKIVYHNFKNNLKDFTKFAQEIIKYLEK